MMLKHLWIRNFRVFNAFEIDRLSHMNLIAGRNNSGKTRKFAVALVRYNRYYFGQLQAFFWTRGRPVPQVRISAPGRSHGDSRFLFHHVAPA